MKLPISPEQAAVLIVVNFIGLSCFGLIFYILIKNIKLNAENKLSFNFSLVIFCKYIMSFLLNNKKLN